MLDSHTSKQSFDKNKLDILQSYRFIETINPNLPHIHDLFNFNLTVHENMEISFLLLDNLDFDSLLATVIQKNFNQFFSETFRCELGQ